MGALLFASLYSGTAVTAGADVTDRESVTAEQSSDEMSAYLFVHFVGEGDAHGEQIYFSVSEDGTHWRTLNGKSPVLESTAGEKGVRDPNIVRKPDGSGFYLIATDLSIFHLDEKYGGEKWTVSQTAGSRGIVVWESENLTDWNLKGLKTIARENATCTWAPEAVYDDEKEAYMIHWASRTKEDGKQRVYRCYTEDFETFTKPELYIEAEQSRIDTTFIKEGDTYYRFTKDEHHKYVYMEKSKSLSGDFQAVNTYTLNGVSHTEYQGYEGPTVYKLNGEDKWCLLLDNYGDGGYKPFVTDDISKGRFVSGDEFDFGGVTFRHGTVIPITKGEYDALVTKYPFYQDTEESTGSGQMIYSLDFEDNLTPGTGTAVATEHGTVSYEAGVNGGKAIKISGNGNYVSVDGSMLSELTKFTVSVTAKMGDGKSWPFYAAPNENEQVYESEKYIGAVANNGTIECERYNSNKQGRPACARVSYTKDEWIHLTLVYREGTLRVYVNGLLEAKVESSVNLADMLGSTPIIQLGKANWKSGEYSNMLLDNFKIYNYELSGAEVDALYKSDMGIA